MIRPSEGDLPYTSLTGDLRIYSMVGAYTLFLPSISRRYTPRLFVATQGRGWDEAVEEASREDTHHLTPILLSSAMGDWSTEVVSNYSFLVCLRRICADRYGVNPAALDIQPLTRRRAHELAANNSIEDPFGNTGEVSRFACGNCVDPTDGYPPESFRDDHP